jgi:hypothetical protein
MKLVEIEKALKQGCKMHGFCSGGGLRVVRVEQKGKLKGYGEHPNVEDALSHANEDLSFGGRVYSKVYGVLKPHYLTGSSEETSSLDAWLLIGNTFDAYVDCKSVIVELRGYAKTEVPQNVIAELDKDGRVVRWTNREYIYETTASIFPDGKYRQSTKIVSGSYKTGANPWIYNIVKKGLGKNFFGALEKALGAPEVEEVK